jgi:hypothetical protein
MKLARFRRLKATCSPSYADYRPKANTLVLLDMDHTKGRPCAGRLGKGKEAKNLNEVNGLTVQELM